MARRLDIEITSVRDDATFTWRAAGAKAPKGVGSNGVLPAGAKVGDVLRADVETTLDGIDILSLSAPKVRERRAEVLQLIGSSKEFVPVTQVSTAPRRSHDDRKGDRKGDRRGSRDRKGRERSGEKRDESRPRKGPFTAPPELTKRPAAKRVKPRDVHRRALLESLKPEERPIAEQAMRGGAKAVREAVKKQNVELAKANQPLINAENLVNLALGLVPRLKIAEWRDSAEAAMTILDDIDLRDLRAIVAKANDPQLLADAGTADLREAMKLGLERRQESEIIQWHAALDEALGVGRVVAALRLAANPPKAGMPPQPEMNARLVACVAENLVPDATSERWVIVLEALAFSPVRLAVRPTQTPHKVSAELLATVARLGRALPQIAELFGIPVDPKAVMPRPLRPTRRDAKKPARSPQRSGSPQGQRPAKDVTTAVEPAVATADHAHEVAAQDPPVAAAGDDSPAVELQDVTVIDSEETVEPTSN